MRRPGRGATERTSGLVGWAGIHTSKAPIYAFKTIEMLLAFRMVGLQYDLFQAYKDPFIYCQYIG